MYCMVFVTVCKIKIPHKGCYFIYGNIVMKTKIVFLLQIVDETNKTNIAKTFFNKHLVY